MVKKAKIFSDKVTMLELSNVFDEVKKSIRKYGADTVIEVLQKIDPSSSEMDELVNFIIDATCNDFKIHKSTITGTKRGEFSDARMMVAVLMYTHAQLTEKEIGRRLKRTKSMIGTYRKRFDDIKFSDIKQNVELMKVFNRLSKIVAQHLQKEE